MPLDPRFDTELKEAQELYFSLGGMPSQHPEPRKAPWYWRRAAKIMRDLREAEDEATKEKTMPRPPINLEDLFRYHPPTDVQRKQYAAINTAALHLARIIVENTPQSADQTAAIRKVREARMTANAAIACAPLAEASDG